MRKLIVFCFSIFSIYEIHACRKSCTKELCETVTDIIKTGCFTGSISTALISGAGPLISSQVDVGCSSLESKGVKYGGCARHNGCKGIDFKNLNKAHKKEMYPNVHGHTSNFI